MHIVIAGNIGSGKSTLAEMLAKHYGWEPFMEPVVDNPYLSDYYKDIKRWSFALEVFFLKQRFKDILGINASDKTPATRPSSRTAASLRACTSSPPTTTTWATWMTAILKPIWNCSSR